MPSVLAVLKWLGSDSGYYGIFKYQHKHFSHTCFLVTGKQILVTLTSLCQAGSRPTCTLHLTIIWSWDAIRNILCPILCSIYLFSLHPPFWSLKSDQCMTQVHALLTSCGPDVSSVHTSPLAASTVQLGCRLIFVFLYSPMISAKALTADFGLLSRQLRATLQKWDSYLNTEIRIAVHSFWFIKKMSRASERKRVRQRLSDETEQVNGLQTDKRYLEILGGTYPVHEAPKATQSWEETVQSNGY